MTNVQTDRHQMIRLTDPRIMLNDDGYYLICRYNDTDYITSPLIGATINDYQEVVVHTLTGAKLLVIPNNKQNATDIVDTVSG